MPQKLEPKGQAAQELWDSRHELTGMQGPLDCKAWHFVGQPSLNSKVIWVSCWKIKVQDTDFWARNVKPAWKPISTINYTHKGDDLVQRPSAQNASLLGYQKDGACVAVLSSCFPRKWSFSCGEVSLEPSSPGGLVPASRERHAGSGLSFTATVSVLTCIGCGGRCPLHGVGVGQCMLQGSLELPQGIFSQLCLRHCVPSPIIVIIAVCVIVNMTRHSKATIQRPHTSHWSLSRRHGIVRSGD